MKPFETPAETVAKLTLEQLHDHIETIDQQLKTETFPPMIRYARSYRQACLDRLSKIEHPDCPF